jgi:O-Antigen ligase
MHWRRALSSSSQRGLAYTIAAAMAVGIIISISTAAAGVLALAILGIAIILARHPKWQDVCALYLLLLITLSSGINSPRGVPLAFLGLFFLCLTIPSDTRPISGRLMRAVISIVVILSLWGLVRLSQDIPKYGAILSLRDALWIPDILATFVGYALYRRLGAHVENKLTMLAATAIIYACLFPMRVTLQNLGATAADEPIVGFAELTLILPFSLFWFVTRPGKRLHIVLLSLCLVELFLLQSRTLYLIMLPALLAVAIATVRSGIGARITTRLSALSLSLFVVLLAAPYLPRIEGRVGPLSVNTFASQINTLHGGEGPGAGGVEQREAWGNLVLHDLQQRTLGIVVGTGFGRDFLNGFKSTRGIPVRKPHNDYIEIIGRMGLLGFLPWICLLSIVLVTTYIASRTVPFAPAIFGFQVVVLFTAATQPVFAFEYSAVPFWLLWGMVLAAHQTNRLNERIPTSEDQAPRAAQSESSQTRSSQVDVGSVAAP